MRRYTDDQLKGLFGQGFDGILSGSPSELYASRCFELYVTARNLQGVLNSIFLLSVIDERRITSTMLIRDDQPVRVFQLCLEHTGMTRDEAIESNGRSIREALTALLDDLNELAKLFTSIESGFGIVEGIQEASLREYTEIANSLRSTREIEVLEQTMKKVASESISMNYRPFVVICASSGTGKTNMAMSLRSPSLYFLHAEELWQPVYQCFAEQSKKLMGFFAEDLRSYTSSKVSVETVKDWKEPLKSVGFLVEMVRRLKIEIECDANAGENPAQLQVKIRSIRFKPMTISDGIQALTNILGEDYFFPITFDECSILGHYRPTGSTETERRAKDIKQFVFLRSVVRSLLCMPIFMGTNAQAANFLGISTGTSTSGMVNLSCWCLVWHRPPGVPADLMTKAFDEMRTTLSDWRTDMKLFPSEGLMDLLKTWLAKERPLFLVYVQEYVRYFCSTMDKCESDEAFLAQLVEYMMEQFRDRKLSAPELEPLINCGQIAYMSQYTWSKELKDHKKGDELLMTEFSSELYIHGHFGYLAATSHDPEFQKYTKIGILPAAEATYKRVYIKPQYPNFTISTRFDLFSNAPLTGLMVTGVTASNACVLCEDSSSENSDIGDKRKDLSSRRRISLIAALDSGIETIKGLAVENSPANSGFRFELALFCASILASRGGGLKGCSFEVFLRHLVRELDCNGQYGKPPPLISFDRSFPQHLKDKMIPFLAAMAIDDWTKELAGRLKELFDAHLGTAIVSTKNNTADLVIYEHSSTPPVLIGECKLWTRTLSAYDVGASIINKFNKFKDCGLFLAVAPRFSDLRSFNAEGTVLWVFEKAEIPNKDGHHQLHLVPAKTDIAPNMKKATKHVVIMDLHTLSTAPESTTNTFLNRLLCP